MNLWIFFGYDCNHLYFNIDGLRDVLIRGNFAEGGIGGYKTTKFEHKTLAGFILEFLFIMF
jgi:hypothetical protein